MNVQVIGVLAGTPIPEFYFDFCIMAERAYLAWARQDRALDFLVRSPPRLITHLSSRPILENVICIVSHVKDGSLYGSTIGVDKCPSPVAWLFLNAPHGNLCRIQLYFAFRARRLLLKCS